LKAAGMTVEQVIKLLRLANNDIQSIDWICEASEERKQP